MTENELAKEAVDISSCLKQQDQLAATQEQIIFEKSKM